MIGYSVIAKNVTRPWQFFTLAFISSWLFWIPAAIMSQSPTFFPLGILYFLGGFGPSIAGVFMVYRTRDQDSSRDFWRRVLSFRRIGPGWYAFIVLVFPVLVSNQRSILSAVLFHFAHNFTFNFVYPIPETVHLSGTALLLIIVVAIVNIWGPHMLNRPKALAIE